MTELYCPPIVLAARRRQTTIDRLPPGKNCDPTPAFAQLLLETQYLSLDPYMRGRIGLTGSPMRRRSNSATS